MTSFKLQLCSSIATGVLSLTILGLEKVEEPSQPPALFIHLEKGQQHLHYEGSKPNGEDLVWRSKGPRRAWPKLSGSTLNAQPKPFQLSQLKQWPKKNSVIFYDTPQVPQHLKPKVWWQNPASRPVVILLDRSGTMGEQQADQTTGLSQAYQFLEQRRAQSSETWELFSFSETLRHHGPWSPDTLPPTDMFSPTSGNTPLLEHLSTCLAQQTQAVDLIILSDGRLDTQDRRSIQQSLQRWNQKGHRLHLLSPSGQPLKAWAPVVNTGLLSDTWLPAQTPLTQGRQSRDGALSMTWSEVRASTAPQHLEPMLWDEHGDVLIYAEPMDRQEIFHIVAQPTSKPKVIEYIKTLRQRSPSVQLVGRSLSVFIPRAKGVFPEISPKTLIPYKLDAETFSISYPEQLDAVSFFHSACGAFQLTGLDHWTQHTHTTTKKSWAWVWSETLPQDWRKPAFQGLWFAYACCTLILFTWQLLFSWTSRLANKS